MIRRPPRSTLDRSSAASDVYKRQAENGTVTNTQGMQYYVDPYVNYLSDKQTRHSLRAVSYTHLRAHETVLDLVCRLLLETKKKNI